MSARCCGRPRCPHRTSASGEHEPGAGGVIGHSGRGEEVSRLRQSATTCCSGCGSRVSNRFSGAPGTGSTASPSFGELPVRPVPARIRRARAMRIGLDGRSSAALSTPEIRRLRRVRPRAQPLGWPGLPGALVLAQLPVQRVRVGIEGLLVARLEIGDVPLRPDAEDRPLHSRSVALCRTDWYRPVACCGGVAVGASTHVAGVIGRRAAGYRVPLACVAFTARRQEE